METLSAQLYAFSIVILAGVSLGFLFDVYRVIRGILRPGIISTALLDLFFWALLAPILAVYLLLANWGELRGYVLIGLILGFLFYRLILSRAVIALLLWIVRIGMKIANLVVWVVLWVISIPLLFVQELGFTWRLRKRRLGLWLKPSLRWRK
ncbi:MAG: hypothetical protein GX331_11035 [Firmicutes bacterium]|nr:hypothetical protein [Bacillota bacterium]